MAQENPGDVTIISLGGIGGATETRRIAIDTIASENKYHLIGDF